MASGIANSDLIDLQRTTLKNLPDLKFETALKYQRYLAINNWFKNHKVESESGTSIERNILLDPKGNAKHVRLFQKEAVTQPNQHSKVTAPWVQVRSSYLIERREALRNRQPARYIDLLQSRRRAAVVDLANEIEEKVISAPNSASDDLNPRGLKYWLSKANDGVTSEGDFIGETIRYGDGSTSTDKGGIDANTHDNWKNYAATYDSVDADLLRRLRRAFHATTFMPPSLNEAPTVADQQYQIYMPLSVIVDYEDLLYRQNDNLGAEGGPFLGNAVFRRVPTHHMPTLNDDADEPIFGVNHAHFFPFIQDGDWMRESDPMEDVELPDVFVTYTTGSYQIFCNNVRQAGFVLHKPISA